MRNFANVVILSFACAALVPRSASAQTTPSPQPPASPPSSPITYRGLETGFDVTTGRKGEAAFYIGASSTRGSLAVRFGKMDAGASVPCSAGVMYEYLFGRNRARITPVAGASFARVFSCASEADGVTAAPATEHEARPVSARYCRAAASCADRDGMPSETPIICSGSPIHPNACAIAFSRTCSRRCSRSS